MQCLHALNFAGLVLFTYYYSFSMEIAVCPYAFALSHDEIDAMMKQTYTIDYYDDNSVASILKTSKKIHLMQNKL